MPDHGQWPGDRGGRPLEGDTPTQVSSSLNPELR
jgi:hypothetical protein